MSQVTTTKKPNISFIDKIDSPRLYYTDKVADQINYLVDACKGEVGWLGLMEQIEDHNAYLVTEIFVPEQKVHGTETEILPHAMLALHEKLEEEKKDPNLLRYWGHSHVNMGTGPSGQDVNQVMDYRDGGIEYFVMAIYNKKGESNVEFFDFANGLRHQGIWNGRVRVGLNEEEKKELDDLIQENVKSFHTYNRGGKYNAGQNNNRNYGRNNYNSNQRDFPTIPKVTQVGSNKKKDKFTEGTSSGGGTTPQSQASGKNETEGQEVGVKVYGTNNKISATKELMWNENKGFYEAEAGA